MAQERKYAAFISYRHVSPDKEIAKALQLMLEYNLIRPNKSAPRHIRKVFLDTSELPTLEDLDAGINRPYRFYRRVCKLCNMLLAWRVWDIFGT